MRKHSKRKVRSLNIPITRGLISQFAQEIHFAIMTADLGRFSEESFDKIAGCMNCIIGALTIRPPKDPAIGIVIQGAVRAMNESAQRNTTHSMWILTAAESAAIKAGAQKAEEALQRLDVMALYQSMQNLQAMRLAERRAA